MTAPIRQALRNKLRTNAGVSAITTKIQPLVVGSLENLPAVVYRKSSAGIEPGMRGGDEIPIPTFEITCWARDIDEAVPLADAVRECLMPFDDADDTYPDDWTTAGNETVTVEDVGLLDESDVFDDEVGSDGEVIYGVRLTFEIQFRET